MQENEKGGAGTILMADPQYFNVEYAINPFMTLGDENSVAVDKPKAGSQWLNLKALFEALDYNVEVLPPQPHFPDLVFCANQSFPFMDQNTGAKSVILSQMRHEQRKGEVVFFRDYYKNHNYKIYELTKASSAFESNGDLLLLGKGNNYLGGVGPRTDKDVYQELQNRFGFEIETLTLIHPNFYHLDTCCFVVNEETCAIIREAFDLESLRKLEMRFKNCLDIPLSEGLKNFAGNAFCPDGKNVILQAGAAKTVKKLRDLSLQVHEVETSEFMKSGGSVFCMKLVLPGE